MLQGFVFTSDQVCPEDSVVNASIAISHIPMDLVFIPMYLGCFQGCGMDHKHQDQNQAIMVSKTKIRIKELCIRHQDQNKAITDPRPSK